MLGNTSLIEQIRKQAEAGSLSHAYLVTGEKGMGKKELVKLLAMEVFCRNKKNGHACGVCPDCKKVLSKNHPDFLYVTHEKPALISVDEIRAQVSDAVAIRPYEGGKKIIVIDDARKMNPQAQNALLKTLEEPPEYVILLLLCDDDRALLDTIRSRCVKMKPELIPTPLVKQFLLARETENGLIDEDTAEMAASFARGNPGRALELATGEEFRKEYRSVVGLCRNIRSMDAADIGKAAKDLSSVDDPEVILELIENWYRDLLAYRLTKSTEGLCYSAEQSAVKSLGAGIRPDAVERIIALTEEASKRLRANVNKELTFTILFLEMRDL